LAEVFKIQNTSTKHQKVLQILIKIQCYNCISNKKYVFQINVFKILHSTGTEHKKYECSNYKNMKNIKTRNFSVQNKYQIKIKKAQIPQNAEACKI